MSLHAAPSLEPWERLLRQAPRAANALPAAADLLTVAARTLRCVDPAAALSAALRLEGHWLRAGHAAIDLRVVTRLRVLAMGKAAPRMASAARELLGPRIHDGLVVCKGSPPALEGFEVRAGQHPVPGPASVEAARAVTAFADGCGTDDVVLFLLSGGASSLMCSPAPGLSLDALQQVSEALLRSGADIEATNCVRKHLETLKGGGLARRLAPARVLGLVLSDVVSDRLDAIGSGPCAPDTTGFADARAVLEHFELWPRLPGPVRRHLEAGLRGEVPDTPRAGERCFERVEHVIVASNRSARRAAEDAARALGYVTVVENEPLTGEASQAGARLSRALLAARGATPVCLVAGGECTVTVRGRGRGGRNQELCLSAAHTLDGHSGVALLSLATDGEDGATPAAGGLITGDTWSRARALGLDPERALLDNASHDLLDALGDCIVTGPTGGNVCDVVVAVADDIL